MKSSADSGSRIEQSASLPGSDELSSADLRRVSSRALRAASRARIAAIALFDDRARVGRVLLEELRELLVDGRLDETLDARVAELRLRLALELRVAQLDGDDCGETLAHVLPFELLVLLQQLHVDAPCG